MRIQHNIAALNSYRNLSTNNNAVSKNLEKLSSGYKINRAGDDAAGLAISEKMRAQITGLETAQKNANDGISLVQTAEGALTEVHSMLNRMVELADQAANGTYDDEVSRANLQKEVESLKDEIDRISKSTNFNGINLLDGTMEKKTVTSGISNVGVTIIKDGQLGKTAQAGKFSIDFTNAKITNTGAAATDNAKFTLFGIGVTVGNFDKGGSVSGGDAATKIADAWNALAEDKRTVAGSVISAEVSGSKVIFTMDQAPNAEWSSAAGSTPSSNAGALKADPNFQAEIGWGNQAEQLDVTVLKEPVDNTQERKYAQAQIELGGSGANGVKVGDGRTLTIGDTTYVFAVGANSQYKDMDNVVDLTDMKEGDVANKLGVIGMRLSEAAKDNKNFKVGTTTVDGQISLTEKEGGVDYTKNDLEGTSNTDNRTDGNWSGLIKQGTVDSALSQKGLTLQIGDTADNFNQLTVSVANMNSESLGIADIDIGTQAGAQAAVDKIKAAINSVSSTRGDLGAIQNRLEHTINNLSVTTENMTAAESRIRDVDMAQEMMAYTKNNILVQASQAMLAQANQIPQGVLQLLQ